MIKTTYPLIINGKREFDELFAQNATVHLEKMNDSQFALIVEDADERVCLWITTKPRARAKRDWPRAWIDAFESWREAKGQSAKTGANMSSPYPTASGPTTGRATAEDERG